MYCFIYRKKTNSDGSVEIEQKHMNIEGRYDELRKEGWSKYKDFRDKDEPIKDKNFWEKPAPNIELKKRKYVNE